MPHQTSPFKTFSATSDFRAAPLRSRTVADLNASLEAWSGVPDWTTIKAIESAQECRLTPGAVRRRQRRSARLCARVLG